jgi:integrase
MQAVHASANKMLFPIVGFLLLTGARRSEALGARWRDMELQRSLWTIPLSKSGKPRHVPLSEAAVELLQEARSLALAAGLSGCDYAFVNLGTGQPFADIAHSWGHARRLVGLPDVRMHDLRHSYASALVNSGRSIYEVQKLLGHASVRTTERYAHLANETLLQGAAKVAEHFTLPRRDDLRDAEY